MDTSRTRMGRGDMKRTVLYLALALAALSGGAAAQNYPSRPITLVIPGAAGGPGDMVGRVLIERMKTSLGQPLVMENVAGANGTIATARAARASPDRLYAHSRHLEQPGRR